MELEKQEIKLLERLKQQSANLSSDVDGSQFTVNRSSTYKNSTEYSHRGSNSNTN